MEAIRRAEAGLVDANLGSGVIKQRIARPGEGRAGGYRSIVLYRSKERAFFVFGFAKNEKDNIQANELLQFKSLAIQMLKLSEKQLQHLVELQQLEEVLTHE